MERIPFRGITAVYGAAAAGISQPAAAGNRHGVIGHSRSAVAVTGGGRGIYHGIGGNVQIIIGYFTGIPSAGNHRLVFGRSIVIDRAVFYSQFIVGGINRPVPRRNTALQSHSVQTHQIFRGVTAVGITGL